MDLSLWSEAFRNALTLTNIAYLLFGTVYGLFIGALPGLGPLFGVALMLPVTFYMEPATAIIFLASIHASTAYGDSWASILINTPGGVGTVATAWDGYPLAAQGRSGYALGIATMSAFFGGVIGWISLITFSPPLTKVALAMGPAEYSMMGVLALSLLSVAAAGQTIKGLILGGIGLMVSFVGQDAITATSRFTFGSMYLEDGFRIVSVALGLFAFSEALVMAEKGGQIAKPAEMKGQLWEGMVEVLKRPITVIRSGVIGVVLGVMPALGPSTANIISYLMEKRSNKEGSKFGTGHPAGVMAPELANNACLVGDLIPTFSLGIPGSSVTAIFLAALMIHGVQVGPTMFQKGGIGYTVFVGILMAQMAFFVIGTISIRWVMKVVMIPFSVLVPLIVVLTSVGAYADRNRVSDILVMVVFGVLGFLLKKYEWPTACLVLGMVLGDIVESNFARAMRISGGDYTTFVTRPLSLTIIILMVLFLISPYFGVWYRKLTGKEIKLV